MSTYFNIRCIRLCPSTVAQYDNTILDYEDDGLAGNWLTSFLHNEGAPISMYRGHGDERETVGNVCDPINVGELPTAQGSLRAHDQLLKFLNRQIFNQRFAARGRDQQNQIRELRNMVESARIFQKAMVDLDAPVIFTVTWC